MKPIDLLVEHLNAKLNGLDDTFTLGAPLKVPVIQLDGTYKTIALIGNEEFFLKGVRSGARSQLIFEFTPVDSKPYSQAEFDEKLVFTAFGDPMHALMMKALDYADTTPWVKARADWLKTKEKDQKDAEKKAAVIAEQKEIDHYGDNPLWGAF